MHIENDIKKTFSCIHMYSCTQKMIQKRHLAFTHAFMHIEIDTRHLALYTCIHAHRK